MKKMMEQPKVIVQALAVKENLSSLWITAAAMLALYWVMVV